MQRRVYRIIGITASLLIFIPVILLECWIEWRRADLTAVDDADLHRSPRPELDDRDNGLGDLLAAGRLADVDLGNGQHCSDNLQAMRSGETWDPDWIEQTLQRNAPAMAALARAREAPGLQLPADETSHDRARTELFPTLCLVRLAGVEARVLASKGDFDGALQRVLLGLALGVKLSRAEGLDLGMLALAVAYQTSSVVDLQSLAHELPLDPAQSRELFQRLEESRLRPPDVARAWTNSYPDYRSSLLQVIRERLAELPDRDPRSGVPVDYLLQPNRTASQLAVVFREQQRRSALQCHEALRPVAGTEPPGRLELMLLPNGSGRIVLAHMTPPLVELHAPRCLLETLISLLETQIGARAYWRARGQLPARLVNLVPEYLPALPRDPFADAELRYSAERRRVYSVGADGIDGGGDLESPLSKAADPTLSLDFSKNPSPAP